MGVSSPDKVQLLLTNLLAEEDAGVADVVSVELFPGHPEKGTRACRRSEYSEILEGRGFSWMVLSLFNSFKL